VLDSVIKGRESHCGVRANMEFMAARNNSRKRAQRGRKRAVPNTARHLECVVANPHRDLPSASTARGDIERKLLFPASSERIASGTTGCPRRNRAPRHSASGFFLWAIIRRAYLPLVPILKTNTSRIHFRTMLIRTYAASRHQSGKPAKRLMARSLRVRALRPGKDFRVNEKIAQSKVRKKIG
jgi:hypothetical protein